MTEVLDMDLAELIDANSSFMEELQKLVQAHGISLGGEELSSVVEEYELLKFQFLKEKIMKVLEEMGHDIHDVAINGMGLIAKKNETSEDEDEIFDVDIDIIS